MKYRKCEICGFRSERKQGKKRFFMARFPLDEVRCKQWVKVTGNEDLIHVPIEKLHQLKFVCGKHFIDKDFKKSKTQLKKTAVPSIQIAAKTLSDDKLKEFPCHIFKEKPTSNEAVRKRRSLDENDENDVEESLFATFDKQPVVYVSGYLASVLLKRTNCQKCCDSLRTISPGNDKVYDYIALKEWWKDKLSLRPLPRILRTAGRRGGGSGAGCHRLTVSARSLPAAAPLFSRVGPFDNTQNILPLPRRHLRRPAARKIRGSGLTYPTLELCKTVYACVSVFESDVKHYLHNKDIGKYCHVMMLKDINLSWLCEKHNKDLTEMLLSRLTALLIRNECRKINASISAAEQLNADKTKIAQLQSLAK